ncbi:MAG: WD40 repeat domain-containing serine/threonine protein kinase [Thermoguttaceae bacterium]
MTACPNCGTSIIQADLQTGKCSACGNEFAAGELAQPPANITDTVQPHEAAPWPPAAEPESDKGIAKTHDSGRFPAPIDPRVADSHRIAETYDSGGFPAPIDPKVADSHRIAETYDSGSFPAPIDPKVADSHRIAQTYDSSDVPVRVDPTVGDSRRYAETFDSKRISAELADKLPLVWPAKFEEGATPRSSIKAEARSIEEEANLFIQPRAVRPIHAPGNLRADYELISELGKGGMGIVHNARQSSIDRTVALKKIKPEKAQEPEARRTFLAEAVVTGDLEHPNIVPIYDLGEDETGVLFYAMKRVKGTPWDKVIGKKSFDENLEIWMKVADAVAFAHSRGVVHRDLKPENVMLGDFGEVLLMDWGLAIVLNAPSAKKAGMAGTPAYMPPEMAMGPVTRVGPASDIYLMGAILYEIITGHTPHGGSTVTACLLAAARNEILPSPHTGELVDIALVAMAARPEDRYASMVAFQDAIRQYRSHSESISLSTRADDDLRAASGRSDYVSYARALFGFQEAYELWEENTRAKDGILEATLAYATRAMQKGDYDLGASLLDAKVPQHEPLLKEIRAAQRDRDARQQRLKTARRIGTALLVTVVVVVTVAFFMVQSEKNKTLAALTQAQESETRAVDAKADAVAKKEEADCQREAADKAKADALVKKKEAEEAKADAVNKKEEADRQREAADKAKAEALAEKKEAENAKQAEEFGAYVARIGLAAAKIEENAFDRARAILQECPPALRNWEWGRLKYLCDRSVRVVRIGQRVEAVAYSPDGERFAIGGWGGTISIWDAETQPNHAGRARDQQKPLLTISSSASCVFALAFSPDGKFLAAGDNDRRGFIKIWNSATGSLVRTLRGHADAVLSLAYSHDGKQLLSGSYDRTAILWDLESDATRSFRGHEGWVFSVAFAPPAKANEKEARIVTASQDGSVIVWSIATQKADPPFQGHAGPVYVARFSPDGKFVASAGYDKRVLLWRPEDVKPFDYEIYRADREPAPVVFESLEGHTAGTASLQFSPNGKLLASGGNDNTVCVWDVEKRKLLKTLRGHAGRVRSVAFAPQLPDVEAQLLTGSYDQSAKVWSLKDYEEFHVFGAPVFAGHQDAILGAAFSPDSKSFVSASRDRTAKVWSLSSGASNGFQQGHEYLATAAAFFRSGKKFLTAAADDTTRIWDAETGMNILTLRETGSSGAAVLSDDENRILTGGKDPADNNYAAKLWDAETGKLLRYFPLHNSEITAVAISRDGRYVFAGDALGCCSLWEANGTLRWENRSGHSRDVKAAAFLPDGRRVLTASSDHTVVQWDVATGKSSDALNLRHPDAVTSLSLTADGQRAVTTCADQVVRVWDVARAAVLKSEAGKENETFDTAQFSPDARWIITTSTVDETRTAHSKASGVAAAANPGRRATSPGYVVRVRDAQNLDEVAGQAGMPALLANINSRQGPAGTQHGATIWTAIFTPQCDGLLTVGGDEARLWDIATGREKMAFSRQGAVASARFSPDGKRVVTSSWDKAVRVWNAETGRPERKLQGHTSSVNDAAFSPDGNSIVTASNDKTAILWDVFSGKVLHTFKGHTGALYRAVLFNAANGSKRLLTASQDGTVRTWDVETEKTLCTLSGHHKQAVLCVAVSQDGSRILTGGEDNVAILWSLNGNQAAELFRLEGHTAAVTSLAFSPDASRAITGSRDDTAKIWELVDGKELMTLKGHSQEVTTVAFSTDGKTVLTGGADGTIVVWPAVDWKTSSPPDDRPQQPVVSAQ